MRQQKRQRQCLYIELALLEEIRSEAFRQDRSLSWIVQRAWAAARSQMRAMPGANDYLTRANDDQHDEEGTDAERSSAKSS